MATGGIGERLITWSNDAIEIWHTDLCQARSAFEQICAKLPDLLLSDLAADLGLGALDPICLDPEKVPIIDEIYH